MAGFYRKSSCLLLVFTALFLLVSHTLFFPSSPRTVVLPARPSLLGGEVVPPEPEHKSTQGALSSAPPSAAIVASAIPTVHEVKMAVPMGGAGAIGPEAVAPYRLHGEEDVQCEPRHERTLPSRRLDLVVQADSEDWPVNCAGNEELCDAVQEAALNREVLVGVANSAVRGQLDKWIESNRLAGIRNMLIVAIDDQLPQWLKSKGVACWARPDKALGSHKISAQKFKFVRAFLSVGVSVLMSDIDVVYLQNPFAFLWRDADIEGTTDGWDDGSAYGWMEELDDPSLGSFGRFRPAMRITAWNSGLWYARATHASLRLMTILAYRMEHEPKTWDQAAFGEEVARPARDAHHAAGIVKRALNYWCFANSKTVFRRMRIEPQVATHKPVVVHANYHQPKQPRMDAVYNRWHLGQAQGLEVFSGEPTTVVPAPELEKNFLHSINDGFVSGGDTRNAIAVLNQGCPVLPSIHGVGVNLHYLAVAECKSGDALCAAARRVAQRTNGREEILFVVAELSDTEALRLMLASAAHAGVTNIVVGAADAGLSDALGDTGTIPVIDVSALLPAHSDNPTARVAEMRWLLLRGLLEAGLAVFVSSASTLFISNPFASLYRDADIEAMSLGWDDPSAYGYNHVIDDPSMGFTRFCHGSRIVGYEPRLFYASPTPETVSLADRMAQRLRAAGESVHSGSASDIALMIATTERESFSRELWLPSRNEYVNPGAILRVMNYLCFANSKVLSRQVLQAYASKKPVLVNVNYHTDAPVRMRAASAAFVDGNTATLRALSPSDTRSSMPAPCTPAGRFWNEANAGASVVLEALNKSPWAWGGVPGFIFEPHGKLVTPWGPGTWGVHAGMERSLFADFIGAQHNLELSHGVAVATRCSDQNVVLLRSVKGIEFPK